MEIAWSVLEFILQKSCVLKAEHTIQPEASWPLTFPCCVCFPSFLSVSVSFFPSAIFFFSFAILRPIPYTSYFPGGKVHKLQKSFVFVFCFKAEQQDLDGRTCRFAACSAGQREQREEDESQADQKKGKHKEAHFKGCRRLCLSYLGGGGGKDTS